MKNGRINERNIGNITLEGEPKKRNRKTLTESEKYLAKALLQKFFDAFEWDKDLRGYTEGGRITCMIDQHQFNDLTSLINKL